MDFVGEQKVCEIKFSAMEHAMSARKALQRLHREPLSTVCLLLLPSAFRMQHHCTARLNTAEFVSGLDVRRTGACSFTTAQLHSHARQHPRLHPRDPPPRSLSSPPALTSPFHSYAIPLLPCSVRTLPRFRGSQTFHPADQAPRSHSCRESLGCRAYENMSWGKTEAGGSRQRGPWSEGASERGEGRPNG
jgi:hypothetical protein